MTDYLSRNFQRRELECRCECGLIPDPQFIDQLQRLRDAYDRPMVITSGARCEEHDLYLNPGRTQGGPHVPYRGQCAVDVHVWGQRAYQLLMLAEAHKFWGLGVCQHGAIQDRYIHLDNSWSFPGRPRPTVWSYDT